MNLMKRLGLAAVLVVGVTLLAGIPARAGEKQHADWGMIQLTNVGDELDASGQATLTKVDCTLSLYDVGEGPYPDVRAWKYYTGVLTVNCQNLAPRATYSTPAGTFKADRNGGGTVKGWVDFLIVSEGSWWSGTTFCTPFVVDVVRLDPDGSSATVLAGCFYPPGYLGD